MIVLVIFHFFVSISTFDLDHEIKIHKKNYEGLNDLPIEIPSAECFKSLDSYKIFNINGSCKIWMKESNIQFYIRFSIT